MARAVADVNTLRVQRTKDAADASSVRLERGQWREGEDASMPLRHCRCGWSALRFLLSESREGGIESGDGNPPRRSPEASELFLRDFLYQVYDLRLYSKNHTKV